MSYVKAPAGTMNPCEPYPAGPMSSLGSWELVEAAVPPPPGEPGGLMAGVLSISREKDRPNDGPQPALREHAEARDQWRSQFAVGSQPTVGSQPAVAERNQSAIGRQSAVGRQTALVVER